MRSGPKRKPLEAGRPVPANMAGWECPEHLKGEAAKAWNHLVGLLRAHGNLGRTDPTLVMCYAMNYALLLEAQAGIARDGLVIPNRYGAPRANPAAQVMNVSSQRLKTIIGDLGLCPATSRYAATTTTTNPALEQEDDETAKWDGLLDVA